MTREVLLIPGRSRVHQSLLTFADVAAQRRGAVVHRLWWSPPAELALEDLVDWVREQVTGALERLESPVLVGKSLGTFAAPLAAEHDLHAIWLTPVFNHERVAEGYAEATRARLFVGGTADPMWDGARARALSPYVLEIEDGDHGLFVPGPLSESARVQGEAADAMERFLDEVVWPG